MGNFLVAVGVTSVVACCALTAGSMQVATDAEAARTRCVESHRRKVSQIPRITITRDELVYQGRLVATVAAILRVDSPTFTIDALDELLARDRHSTCDPATVCLDALVVLQLTEDVDARVISKVVNTAWRAGFDVVHAPIHRPDSW